MRKLTDCWLLTLLLLSVASLGAGGSGELRDSKNVIDYEITENADGVELTASDSEQLFLAVYLEDEDFKFVSSRKNEKGQKITFSVIGSPERWKSVTTIESESETIFIYDVDGDGLPDRKAVVDNQTLEAEIYSLEINSRRVDEKTPIGSDTKSED